MDQLKVEKYLREIGTELNVVIDDPINTENLRNLLLSAKRYRIVYNAYRKFDEEIFQQNKIENIG